MASCSTFPVALSAPTTTKPTSNSPDLSFPPATLKTPTIRSRLSKLCQEGQPYLARQLFDTFPRPTTVLWNTIIIGFVCNNLPQQAILFYTHMKNSSPNTKSDSYTYSSTLKACAETRNFNMGRAVHCHILRCLPNPSRIVHNSLMNMYSSCAPPEFDYVRKVFDTMRKRNVVAWNTLISWYVKTERYEEAIKQFRMMMRMRTIPSAVSFVNLFPALSALGDYTNAKVLYGLVLRFGADYVYDLFVVSSAIYMYADLGCIGYARKVFDQCLERNTEILNTMIGGYVQNNLPGEAIDLFFQAIQSEQAVHLDEVTFLSALTACSQLQQLELAGQLHAFITKRFRLMPVILLNAIIVMYSRCNSVETSFKFFHKMPERDIVSWNTMISAFVQNGLDNEALMLVHEMQKQNFSIDSVTITALLSAASNLRNLDIGQQTHAYLIRHGIEFEGMESYLIDMYAKSGSVWIAERIFKQDSTGHRDQATWNSMVSGYTQNEQIEQAFVVFGQMIEQKLLPNAVTLTSIIPACNPVGNIEMGKQLHGFSIRHYLDRNVFVGTALVDMYAKCGAITSAENVFSETLEKNSITYTTMILGYGQHGMGEKAVSLFYSMKGSGIVPDAITFVAVLSACSYVGLVDVGLSLYDSMKKEYNIKPLISHYCCITDMLGRVGRVAEAYEFVKGLGEEGNAMEIWASLLGACRIHKQIELGKIVAEKLFEIGAANGRTGYHVLLSNMYAEEEDWKNVDKVRTQMRERGMKKETGYSWIDITGLLNCFISRDQRHP